MLLMDPHIHMTSRTTDDYQRMRAAGIVAVVEPSFWGGQSRNHVGSFEDYYLSIVGWERFRASQFGIRHFCAIGLNPKEANRPDLVDGVLALMAAFLVKESVVAVGEIGFDEMTAAEEDAFVRQLDLAARFDLPAIVHLPHRDKKRGCERSLEIVRASALEPGRVIIDHCTEDTTPLVLDAGCWAAHSIYPHTKMDEARMVALVKRHGPERMIVNSAADWGISDPLKVPATAAAMEAAGIDGATIRTVLWDNPVAFFAQSGRFTPDELAEPLPVDQTMLYQGNSVLRGQSPRVDA
ncbi:MAG: TatD family hydrolase [Actinomycetota bacterium]